VSWDGLPPAEETAAGVIDLSIEYGADTRKELRWDCTFWERQLFSHAKLG
jgi:hypothetical protein